MSAFTFSDGDSPSGTATIVINNPLPVFAAVGTTGNMRSFSNNTAQTVIVGTYTVTPIPAALPLLASGLYWLCRRNNATA